LFISVDFKIYERKIKENRKEIKFYDDYCKAIVLDDKKILLAIKDEILFIKKEGNRNE